MRKLGQFFAFKLLTKGIVIASIHMELEKLLIGILMVFLIMENFIEVICQNIKCLLASALLFKYLLDQQPAVKYDNCVFRLLSFFFQVRVFLLIVKFLI